MIVRNRLRFCSNDIEANKSDQFSLSRYRMFSPFQFDSIGRIWCSCQRQLAKARD